MVTHLKKTWKLIVCNGLLIHLIGCNQVKIGIGTQGNTSDTLMQIHQMVPDRTIPTGHEFDHIDPIRMPIPELIKCIHKGIANVAKLVLDNSGLNKVMLNKSNTDNNQIVIKFVEYLTTIDPNSPIVDNNKAFIPLWKYLSTIDPNSPVSDNAFIPLWKHLTTIDPNNPARKAIDFICASYTILNPKKDIPHFFPDWQNDYTVVCKVLIHQRVLEILRNKTNTKKNKPRTTQLSRKCKKKKSEAIQSPTRSSKKYKIKDYRICCPKVSSKNSITMVFHKISA